jgi:hypothetical protein
MSFVKRILAGYSREDFAGIPARQRDAQDRVSIARSKRRLGGFAEGKHARWKLIVSRCGHDSVFEGFTGAATLERIATFAQLRLSMTSQGD